jgi:hypothetical protein
MANEPKSLWWAIASAVVMVLGAFGPWARILGIVSVNGTDGDGWIVIVAALIAVGLIVLRQRRKLVGLWPVLVALLTAMLAAATVIYDWTDLNGVADRTGLVEARWGIYVATIGSCSLVLACVGLLLERPRAVEEPAAPPAASGE